MRSRVVLYMVLVLVAMVACQGISAARRGKQSSSAAGKTKVLLEVGGPVHDQPELYAALKQRLEATGKYVVAVTDNRDALVYPNINAYDVVMIYTTQGALTDAQEKGLVKFVEDGGGVIGIHSATDSFRNSDAYWKLIGGRSCSGETGPLKVKITGKSHSAMQGLSDFDINDETCKNEFHKESKPIVLMRREEDGEPVSWVQYVGKGRVFVTSLGHGKDAWEDPAFQKMIDNALEWTTGKINP